MRMKEGNSWRAIRAHIPMDRRFGFTRGAELAGLPISPHRARIPDAWLLVGLAI